MGLDADQDGKQAASAGASAGRQGDEPPRARVALRWRTPVQVALLVLLPSLALAPVVDAEFIWDDFRQVVQSEQIRSLGSIPGYFTHHVWERETGVDAAEGILLYRPVFQTALALEYRIVGGASPGGFHLGSLACHLTVALLLWALARRWMGLDGWPALAVGLLFAMHPVTTEAYAWVSALTDLLACAGLLAGLLLVDHLGVGARASQASSPARYWVLAMAAGLAFLAGMMGKEVALLALPAAGMWLWLGRGVRLVHQVPLWIAGAVFVLARMAVLGGLEATGRDAAQLLTAVHHAPILLVDGLRALVALRPVGYRGLAYEYDAISWLWSGGAAVALALLCVVAWRLRRRVPLFALALGIHCAVVAPAAMIATVPGWGGFGRYLYIPSAFVALVLVQGALEAGRWARGRIGVRVLWLLPLVPLAYVTLQQSALRDGLRAYSNSEQLALSGIDNAPGVGVGYELHGHVLMDRGDLAGAILRYEAALERTPELLQATINLCLALVHTGHPEEGLARIQAWEVDKGRGPRSSYVTALALLHLGRVDEAAARLLWAIAMAPGDGDLLWLQAEVLARHPDPSGYREWLSEELERPEYAAAAPAIQSMLEPPAPRSTTAP